MYFGISKECPVGANNESVSVLKGSNDGTLLLVLLDLWTWPSLLFPVIEVSSF
jgi:hypothetical protein